MRSLFGLLVSSVVILFVGYSGWMHLRHATDSVELQAGPVTEQARRAATTYNQPQDSQPGVTLAGPLANYMQHQGVAQDETVQAEVWKPTEADHVGGSVVGTSNKVLHETFIVAGTVDLPFEVPAHAYTPKFRGTFRSFIQAGGAPTTAPGDIDFLLLSEQQYSDLLNGHPGDALFSADTTHNQDVAANLPPTLDQARKYHVIFRNVTPKTGKKVVHAEFQMDF